ncbi:hypothetical protein [Paractinoplanes toevensis]|uniref:Uncharacterized protein n=1 Tax=Paractinoplanes toevensis TaxID=571911 RepID=A0A919TI12_9ACTN|nr:hypothetical protein [Actinoplanes toevensis]GIM95326.1 hypothetical protein Ato02nite_071190 [Actinoplanes toevensis]
MLVEAREIRSRGGPEAAERHVDGEAAATPAASIGVVTQRRRLAGQRVALENEHAVAMPPQRARQPARPAPLIDRHERRHETALPALDRNVRPGNDGQASGELALPP